MSVPEPQNREKFDPVNRPEHYHSFPPVYEPLKVIEAWGLGFHLGNSIKYIARCEFKGNPIQDLKKALFYLEREIQNREKLTNGS